MRFVGEYKFKCNSEGFSRQCRIIICPDEILVRRGNKKRGKKIVLEAIPVAVTFPAMISSGPDPVLTVVFQSVSLGMLLVFCRLNFF